jgi:pyruvate/2-oxoglutarate dehydrogenase complex dihydrolipoamide acyltransferase (E2) component
VAVWHHPGAFIERPANVAPEALGQAMVANGFTWAAILVHNGLQVENEEELGRGWIARLAGQGVTVGGWAPLRDDPEREAELAAQLCDRWGLAFYVANAEYEYEFSGKGGGSNERAARSGRFVTAFRARKPDLPGALSTFGRLDQHDLDWTPWRNAGFHFLPQAYPNEDPSLTVPLCAAGAGQALASPRLDLAARAHPTIGVYPGPLGLVEPHDYVAQLATEPRSRGFSVYLAERMDAAWWPIYGTAIREGRILAGEPPEPEPEPAPRKPEPAPKPAPKPRQPQSRAPTAPATRTRMLELARAMEQEWARQGRDPEVVARSRIAVARAVLEAADPAWEGIRDELRALLTPPPAPGPAPPDSDT